MQPQRRDPYSYGLELSAKSRHAEAICEFERALAARSDDIRVLFALGNTARALGLPGPAEAFFRRVLALEPERLEALVNLANLLRANGNHAAAEALIEPALVRNPDAAELWVTLASIARERGDGARAASLCREALARDPNCSAALGNLADLLADDGDVAEALVLYERAIRHGPHNPQLRLNRAVLNLSRGALKDGWRDYAARLKISGKAPVCDHRLKPWNGESLKRTRLLVTAEQGIGDQIMFASLIPELAQRARDEGGAILLECEPRLVALFQRSFPSVSVHGADMQTTGGVTRSRYVWLKGAGGANAATEMGTLPRILRRAIEQFPNPHAYLVPDTDEGARWRARFADTGPAPYIGICWRSGKAGGLRNLQFAPPALWAESIARLPGTIVCVQYDATRDEVSELERLSGRTIHCPAGIDQKQEIDRTCALLGALDRVLSAPTAVSWLGAAAGVPTYKILYHKSWTSFGLSYEPFAPACSCLMPATRGDWRDVLSRSVAGTAQ